MLVHANFAPVAAGHYALAKQGRVVPGAVLPAWLRASDGKLRYIHRAVLGGVFRKDESCSIPTYRSKS